MAISWPIRVADRTDIAALKPLMDASIRALLDPFLAKDAVEASFSIMGLDTQLIDDGSYYVIDHPTGLIGAGGWSRRATLFGGDHTAGRNAALLDPARDAARVRAMYTHPNWTRRGIGRAILDSCEAAAARAGFWRFQLAATLAGEPLYRACGYEEVERFFSDTPSGVRVPLVRMEKSQR